MVTGPEVVSWSRQCLCVCVRTGGGDGVVFGSGVKLVRARVNSGARASSITRSDISATKRLQSNRPINLISARMCQSAERCGIKEEPGVELQLSPPPGQAAGGKRNVREEGSFQPRAWEQDCTVLSLQQAFCSSKP